MKNKLSMTARVGVLILVFTSFSMAQLHHLTYTGSHFSGDSAVEYEKVNSSVRKLNTSGTLYAPVVFPDSANGLQVTRLSFSMWDSSVSGELTVVLGKVDRWTANTSYVASKSTGITAAVSSLQYMNLPKSQMVARGIDNNRWAWFLRVDFSEGNTSLYLHHITIRYE